MSMRVTLLVVCLGTPMMGGALRGQTVATPETSQHIATISLGTAVMHTNEAKRDFGALENKFAPRQKELESLNREIDDMRKRFNDQRTQLSDSELNSRTQALAAKQKQLDRAEEDFRNDSQSDGEQAFRRIEEKVFEFLQVYAQDHGYVMIIDRGTENSPVVLYATRSADITNDVVSAYNARSGVAAPAPAGSNNHRSGSSSPNSPQPVPRQP